MLVWVSATEPTCVDNFFNMSAVAVNVPAILVEIAREGVL